MTVDPIGFDPDRFSRLAPLQMRARYVMEGFLDGVHKSPFHGPSVEFSEYRDYQPGDDLRHVDWRLYARRDRLAVKRYEQETNARCYLLVDTSASMAYRGEGAWDSKLGAAKVLAAALAWILLRQGDAVGLMARGFGDSPARGVGPRARRVRGSRRGTGQHAENQQAGHLVYLPPSRVRSRLGELLGRLRQLETTPAPGPSSPAGEDPGSLASLLDACAHRLHRRSLVFVASDLLDPSEGVRRALERLRFDGHDCRILQVLDRDELELPFAEGAVLEDLETGLRRQVSTGARRRYLSRLRTFLEDWHALLRRLEIRHTLAVTDADPARALSRLLLPPGSRILAAEAEGHGDRAEGVG
ncbi:MAG: DUF58 domain-containing protein [Holophagales bacterium]|nr:DUF58 domain-containing protein [Holophagales bacterium]